MNFDLQEDEEMLKAAVERFVLDRYDVEKRRGYLNKAAGFDAENWSLLAELGVFASPFPEELGGLGLKATGIAVIFEALGRGVVVEPVLESCILPGLYLSHGASEAVQAEELEGLMTGEKRIAMAHMEMQMRSARDNVRTTARSESNRVILNGEKAYSYAGGQANAYLVSAIGEGSASTSHRFYLVPANTPGLGIEQWRFTDGTWMASLTLKDVNIPADHALNCTSEEAQTIEALASLARSAEALGIMEAMFAETLEYLNTRQQFGMPLGKFQSLQHRMADQYAAKEQCRALIELAIVSEEEPDFARHVDGARSFIAEASLTLGHEMIQMHGGMGITDELSIGQGHKRLLVLSRWPEQPLDTLDRFASAH